MFYVFDERILNHCFALPNAKIGGLAKRQVLLRKFGNAGDQVAKVTGVGSRIVPLLCTIENLSRT